MAGDKYKMIRCTVYRADDAEDLTAIPVNVGVGDELLSARINPGESVVIAQPIYEALCLAKIPAIKSVEVDGQLRTEEYLRPRFAITVDGIETEGEANARVASLALEQGKELDALKEENDRLKAMLAVNDKNNVIPEASAIK